MKEVRVKVQTGVKRELIEEGDDGRFLVSVNAPRKEGRANERVCELIAAHFLVPVERVRVVRGKSEASKTIRIYEEETPPVQTQRSKPGTVLT